MISFSGRKPGKKKLRKLARNSKASQDLLRGQKEGAGTGRGAVYCAGRRSDWGKKANLLDFAKRGKRGVTRPLLEGGHGCGKTEKKDLGLKLYLRGGKSLGAIFPWGLHLLIVEGKGRIRALLVFL